MAGTTLEFYEKPEQYPVSQYGGAAGNLYQIAAPRSKDAPLTKLIEAYQISQYKTSLAGCSGLFSKNLKDYEGLVHKVEAFERSGGLRADSKAEPLALVVYSKELCKNKFTVLAIYGIMAIRRYDHGRTNSYYAAIT